MADGGQQTVNLGAGGLPAMQPPGQQMGQLPNPGFPMQPPASYVQQFAALEQQREQLRQFWEEMREEVSKASTDPADFKNQQLPLARIKKIMKSDEDVRMISAEAPVLFAKACEFFILELTLRAWGAAEEGKRKTLQRSDIAVAVNRTDVFDFLVDIVPQEEGADAAQGGQPGPSGVPPPGMQPPGLGMFPGMPQFMPGMHPGGMMGQPGGGMPQQQAGGPPGMPPNMAGMAPPPHMYMGGMPGWPHMFLGGPGMPGQAPQQGQQPPPMMGFQGMPPQQAQQAAPPQQAQVPSLKIDDSLGLDQKP